MLISRMVLQERYRNDLNIAIQLLQCKPSNFVPQKCDTVSFILIIIFFFFITNNNAITLHLIKLKCNNIFKFIIKNFEIIQELLFRTYNTFIFTASILFIFSNSYHQNYKPKYDLT